MYVCTYVRTYVCMYVCMYVHVYACMYVCVCVNASVCMCACAAVRQPALPLHWSTPATSLLPAGAWRYDFETGAHVNMSTAASSLVEALTEAMVHTLPQPPVSAGLTCPYMQQQLIAQNWCFAATRLTIWRLSEA